METLLVDTYSVYPFAVVTEHSVTGPGGQCFRGKGLPPSNIIFYCVICVFGRLKLVSFFIADH